MAKQDENYLLSYENGIMHVLLHEDAASPDVVRSVLHALKFHDTLSNQAITKKTDWTGYMKALEESRIWTEAKFPSFMGELEMKGWKSDSVYWNDG